MRKIDAHQHYWKLDRGDYGWLTPEGTPAIYRDFLPADLEPELKRCGIDRTILVQAAATHAETTFMLQLSEKYESIAGVVGWLNLDDSEWPAAFETFRSHPKFVGFRFMIQEMKDARDALRPHILDALRQMAASDIPVDLLAVSHQLPVVVELLEQVPGLRAVIDHLCKPQIAAGVIEPWASQMREIARHPKVYCKLSGMVTEADHHGWKPEHFTSYVRHIVDIFGPDRVMYGSDWPVCLLAASYSEVHGLLGEVLPESLTESQLAAIYGGNAAAFYKL
ncbi:amidohydrolase family protein [Paenibacillus sp. sptzw28]|uniref:amidohydrolase family protein n=1 Tax=Paenibacillus sp. sptzw28 TaxID=715179 RepID=UPI001C6DD52E|nr:amidohydrolase family protein [Paenibacillus sp. sptzw28]QYR23267.1 amidohydrolase family protein [Paenibacillus sp. sptzw28]